MPQDQPAPQPGSQPASQPAPAPAAGPNSNGSSPAQATDNRQAQQDTAFYNKTQNVATQQRQVDQSRQDVERREAALNYPGNSQTPFGQQPPANNQPGYAPQSGQPQYGQMAIPPETARGLVSQFGYEGAEMIVAAANQIMQPVVQNLQMQSQQIQEHQRNALESAISARGQEAYGEAWKEAKAPVMDLIKQYGIPLDVAYNAVTAGKAKQKGTDEAYQNMQRKEDGNVQTQASQPSPSAGRAVESFGDAFDAAWQEHQQG